MRRFGKHHKQDIAKEDSKDFGKHHHKHDAAKEHSKSTEPKVVSTQAAPVQTPAPATAPQAAPPAAQACIAGI